MGRKLLLLCVFSTVALAQTTTVKQPPLYFGVSPDDFSGTGRWIPSNSAEKAAFPSETQIDCDRRTSTCVEATAEYFYGHPHVNLDYFEVLKWSEDGIIASSSNGICMVRTVQITFATKAISGTDTVKKLDAGKKGACTTLGASKDASDTFVIKNSARWLADPYGESLAK